MGVKHTSAIDAETLAGKRFEYQEDMSLVEDLDLMELTPGGDLNWLEDIHLLVEDGSAEAELMADALDPTALVEQQLALAELPWLKRRRGKRVQKRRMAEAAASTQDLGLPGLSELSELGELPED